MQDDISLIPARERTLPPGCRLVEGDCFAYMAGVDDGEVDHVISDPPYGETTHKGARTTKSGPEFGAEKLVHFDSITDDQFIDLCRTAVRVAKRWVVMTCEWRHAVAAEQALPKEFVRCGVWVKPDSMPQLTGDRPGTGWEAVLMLHRQGKKRWNGGGHHAVWTHLCERGKHPTQKPLPLLREWVRQFTDPGDLILDPFAGSGTTGEAALLEGRRCVLVEKDPKFADVIRARLDKPFPKPPLRDRKTGDEVIF